MKKILIACLVITAGLTGYSFYADAADKPEQKQMHYVEREVVKQEKQMRQNAIQRAQDELESWNKLSRDEKLKLIELKHAEKVKQSAQKWAKKSADKKLAEYEKRLKKRAMSKEEKAKIAREKLNEKCKELEE